MRSFIIIWTHLYYLAAQAQSSAPAYTNLLPYSHQQYNALAFASNPAALGDCRRFSLGVYGERPFLLKELSRYMLGLVLPTPSGQFGIQALYAGTNWQRQTKLGLAYARRIGAVGTGLQFNRHTIATEGYGQVSFLTLEGGLLLNLGSALRTGLHIIKVAGLPARHQGIPAEFSMALGYDASDQFFIGIAVTKTENRDVGFQSGFEYRPQPAVRIRTGIITAAAVPLFYFGIGLSLENLCAEMMASVHPQLGFTPGLSLLYPSTDVQ